MLTPNPRARAKERLLLYGYLNSGKTYAWTTLADIYRKTSTPGHFFVVSTEWQAAERAIEPYPDADENITIIEALDWAELASHTQGIAEKATEDDWLVFDSIGNAWAFVQDDYCNSRWGVGAKEYFGNLSSTNDSDINWQIVNARYQGWMLPNVVRFTGHLFATSPGEALRQPSASGKGGESREIRQMFGRIGVKPDGQKRLAYMLHTVLYAEQATPGDYTLTSVDDHGREQMDREPVAPPPMGFVSTYLVGKAGWSL
jgi:hypothetical protein